MSLKVKAAVRKRDKNRCARCLMTNRLHRNRYGKSLHVHRRDNLRGYSLANCETLCYGCHGLTRRADYHDLAPIPPAEEAEADSRESFHLPPKLRDALNSYISHTKPKPGKSAVLRAALEEFLERAGFWPPPSAP